MRKSILANHTGNPSPFPEQYDRYFHAHSNQFASVSAPATLIQPDFGTRRYEIPRAFGSGWTDMHAFSNGMLVGRMHCKFSKALGATYTDFPNNIRVGIRLSGYNLITHGKREWMVSAGDIFVRNANTGTLHNRLHNGGTLTAVAIDIPCAMLHTLKDLGVDTTSLGPPDSCTILKPATQTSFSLRKLCMRIMRLQTCRSVLVFLELESLSLELLLNILAANPARRPPPSKRFSKQWLAALDTVMDILHTEWSQPLTISLLARRAGINECYLKTLFRQRTGQTISTYLRSLRMQHALGMMESSQLTVQQVAHFCGYLHAGKFSQAFRREHGVAPSEIGLLAPSACGPDTNFSRLEPRGPPS